MPAATHLSFLSLCDSIVPFIFPLAVRARTHTHTHTKTHTLTQNIHAYIQALINIVLRTATPVKNGEQEFSAIDKIEMSPGVIIRHWKWILLLIKYFFFPPYGFCLFYVWAVDSFFCSLMYFSFFLLFGLCDLFSVRDTTEQIAVTKEVA